MKIVVMNMVINAYECFALPEIELCLFICYLLVGMHNSIFAPYQPKNLPQRPFSIWSTR